MDFNFSPENRMTAQSARAFCEREIAPIYVQVVANKDYPSGLLQKFAKTRMFGPAVPKEYGETGGTAATIWYGVPKMRGKSSFSAVRWKCLRLCWLYGTGRRV